MSGKVRIRLALGLAHPTFWIRPQVRYEERGEIKLGLGKE
jgi:hypothetical protein